MASSSMIIRNGRIVDGTGAPAYVGDLAIKGDRIVAIGRVTEKADVEIDAGGKVVAPGFIDVHTHYDPQLCWDRLATPTPEHGVTSLVMGNCSVSLAPVRKEQRGALVRWFGSVEDMEGRLLEAAVPFEWESIGQYLDYLRKGLGPNVGVFIGHAVIRLYVMGAESQKRIATDDEIAKMCDVLRQGLADGAFGLSFTYNHLDDIGGELPCSFADKREVKALLEVVAKAGRMVEVAPDLRQGSDPLKYIDLFGELALETGATCTLSPVLVLPPPLPAWDKMLARFKHWRGKGAPIFAQTQVRPLDISVVMAKGSLMFSKMTRWRQIMDMPLPERIKAFADKSERGRLNEEILSQGSINTLGALVVKESKAKANAPYLNRSVKEICETEKRGLADVILDISLADNLETEFVISSYFHADTKLVGDLLEDPVIHIGSADAGAHITSFSGAGDTCYLFEHFVRREKKMTVERAVQRLTSDIAKDWHIADRGVLAVGKFADVVIFDPETIARGKEVWVSDLPGGSGRYVRPAFGIDRVIVNGNTIVHDGKYTGATPGKLI